MIGNHNIIFRRLVRYALILPWTWSRRLIICRSLLWSNLLKDRKKSFVRSIYVPDPWTHQIILPPVQLVWNGKLSTWLWWENATGPSSFDFSHWIRAYVRIIWDTVPSNAMFSPFLKDFMQVYKLSVISLAKYQKSENLITSIFSKILICWQIYLYVCIENLSIL